jgi:hypothetical protein
MAFGKLARLNEARTQYHWAIANIAIALLCVLLVLICSSN